MVSSLSLGSLRVAWQGLALASSRPLVVRASSHGSPHRASTLRAHMVSVGSSRSLRAPVVVQTFRCQMPVNFRPRQVCLRPVPAALAVWGRSNSSSAGTKQGNPEIMSVFQSGLDKPELIEYNKEKRTIRAQEFVVKAIHSKLVESVPGVFLTLDENGRNIVNWPAPGDAAVAQYLSSHRGSNLQNTFVYQGAFAIGVKRTKVLSLFSLILTSLGGPLLVLGEANPSVAQYAVAGAVVIFGMSTTALLHLITSPYVLTLRKIADGSYEAESPLITGGVKHTKFTRQEVMPSARPFTSFTAKGQGFFVHKELFIGDDAQMMLCDLLGDQAAEVMYENLLKKDPNDLDTLYNYGRFLWKIRGDYEAAEGAFTAILAEDPNDREVRSALQLMQKERAAVSGAPAA